MERPLRHWIKDKQWADDSVTETTLSEKAGAMYQNYKNRHSDKLASGHALNLCDDPSVRPNRNMLQGRQRQTPLDRFILKRPAGRESETKEKLANQRETSNNERRRNFNYVKLKMKVCF